MQLSAIIIAGGKSKRMGFDKTNIVYQGKTFLQNAVDLLRTFSDDIIISSNQALSTAIPVIPDVITDMGPIGGLYACLPKIKYDKSLVIPVDMPLLNAEIINHMIQNADFQKDINIFQVADKLQSLVGIYDKNTVQLMAKQIEQKDYKLRHLLQKSAYHLIDGSKFATQFINVNSPEELAKIKSINEL